MHTVWVSRAPRTPRFVDVKISGVLELPRMMNRF
jgi:hypothetical protein